MAYFANSSEGAILDNQCAECEFGEKPCPIYLVQAEYNYSFKQGEKGQNLLDDLISNKDGCQMFKLLRQEKGESNKKIIARLTARINELEAGQKELFK